MKKIFFLVNSMQGGGAEYVASLLSNYWVGKGHEVFLLATFSRRGKCIYHLDSRVRLNFLADFLKTTKNSMIMMFLRFLKIRKIVRSYEPDVVISFHPQVNIAAILATTGLGLRTVVAERTYPPAIVISRLWLILRRLFYPHATKVVMQTEQGLKWLQKESPASRGCVIPNPCIFPLPQYKPKLLPSEVLGKERLVILSAGRLSEEKGFVKAIKAFAKLEEAFTKWDFVILGEGPERPVLEKLILKLGLQDRVYLPGRVGNLGIWYDRADVYLLSSRFEGFPNALLEAMSQGISVVSFDCDTGPRDLIEDGINGYLVRPSDGISGLVKKLEALMSDVLLREKMGGQARNVRNQFSMESVGMKWDQVLGLSR